MNRLNEKTIFRYEAVIEVSQKQDGNIFTIEEFEYYLEQENSHG